MYKETGAYATLCRAGLNKRKGGATGVWGGPTGFCPANNFLLQYGFRSKRNNVSTNAENELKVVTFAFVVFDL